MDEHELWMLRGAALDLSNPRPPVDSRTVIAAIDALHRYIDEFADRYEGRGEDEDEMLRKIEYVPDEHIASARKILKDLESWELNRSLHPLSPPKEVR